jgi:hypothetical protein
MAFERMGAERAECDGRGKRKRGDEQAESGVHPGYPRDAGGRLRASIRTYEGSRYSSTNAAIEQHPKANQRAGVMLLLQGTPSQSK